MLLAVALASTLGGLCVGPVLADDRDRRQEQQNRAWQRQQQQRAWQQEQARRDYHRRQTYRPVYVPPPVVYAPAPSPGISIFFPLFR
jgi:transcription initiation factor TFIID subunit TAF12